MRHVRDVLRLKFECKLRNRPIAKSLGISRNTIRLILQRSQKVGVVWPLPPDLTDSALENLLGSLHLHLRRGVPVPDPPRMDRRPRDKAKVENGFLLAKHWVLAVLRHRVFHSLAEMNAAIRELLEKLNDRLLRAFSRLCETVFTTLDGFSFGPNPTMGATNTGGTD